MWPLSAPLGPDGPAGFGFAAALAVRDAAAQSGAMPGRLMLKWPNDVLLDGAKLSGLLIELLTSPPTAVAIGIGVNLAAAPDGLPYPAKALSDAIGVVTPAPAPGPIAERRCGTQGSSMIETAEDRPRGGPGVNKEEKAALSPARFLARLDAAFLARMDDWRAEGFVALRDAWLASAKGLGEPVTVRLPNETLEGVFEDLGPTGALVLRTPHGLRTITAGDVFFPEAAR